MKNFSWLPGAEGSDEDAREAFAQNEEMMKAAALIQREEARLFLDVFSTGRGPELLELMQAKTLDLDLMAVSPVIGSAFREMNMNPADWAFHRNGQNSVVRWIIQQIRLAQAIENEETNNV